MVADVIQHAVIGRTAWVLVLVASIGYGCDADAPEPPVPGLYEGERVAFLLSDGRMTNFQFTGISCVLPYPENPVLNICAAEAEAAPDEELSLQGNDFSGLVGGVALDGRIDGAKVSGSFHFIYTACPQGYVCDTEGSWSAECVNALDMTGADAGVSMDDGVSPEQGPVDDGYPQQVVPDNVATHQQGAADLLWEIRRQIGVPMARQVSSLNDASQSHAEYYERHAAKYADSGISAHYQNPQWTEGFTGETLSDRLAYFGASVGAGASEVMAFVSTETAAIYSWLETLYHRIPLIHPNTVEWGFGMTADNVFCEVLDSVYGPADGDEPARWPLPDAQDVSASWWGNESPQPPLPAGVDYPSGPVVTLTFPSAAQLTLTSSELRDASNQPVPAQVQSPANDSRLSSTWALYAYEPLEPSTRYTVTYDGIVNGEAVTETWSFTTVGASSR